MGIAYGEINDASDASAAYRVGAKGIRPALGVGAGVERFIASNVSFSADVRWIYTWDHAIKVADGPSQRGDFSAVLFTIGFRAYLFNL